ncbi:MAG: VWA domain-containing protein, partial [Ignavibacteriaceae bacterium]|nr:VWA domain-containing protein [Ignavibacteriaceae bacterium]
IAAYSFYVYRYTIPQVNQSKKILLISLRVLALLLLCFILFEPILNLSRKFILEPANLVFIDNSRSITIEDGTNRSANVKQILDDFSVHASADNLKFFEFGNSVREVSDDSLDKVNFSNGSTNLEDVFNFTKSSDKNIASVTLISDGVLTSGSNPYYDAINLGIPLFTIGIGDTTQRKDIEIKKVLHNDFLYAKTPTSIIATIYNKGFSGESIIASMYEDNKFISQQNVILSSAGIQNISFDYNPESSGEKKMSISIKPLKNEFTNANNKKIFYVNVLSNKINVVLVASSPSADLTFINNALKRDENLKVSSIVQVAQDKFLDKWNYQILDSANVLFLIGFPSDQTPKNLLNRVIARIKSDKVPYFLTLSAGISLNKLSLFGDELSFTVNQLSNGYREVQPQILEEQSHNPILKQGNKNLIDLWNNLPPVLQPNSLFNPRIESKMLAQIKVNNKVINSPLILIKNFSGNRSVTVLGKDIWKWKLQVAPKGIDLFDSFIVNSLRWLRAGEEQKLVSIKSSKKNYSQGERIEFSAQVFDESLNPVSDAEIKLKIRSDKNEYETDMQNVGPGLYEGSIIINETGDFGFSGEAYTDGTLLGKDNGSFNIDEIDLEMINPVMNYSLLNLLANNSGGEFYTPDDYKSLMTRINQLNKLSSKEKIIKSEITLWSHTWMLLIAIFLFSLEWFIRKRSGML